MAQLRFVLVRLFAALSALVLVIGYVLDGLDIISLGLPVWAWQAIGATVFVVMVGFLVHEKRSTPKVTEDHANRIVTASRQAAPKRHIEFFPDQPGMIQVTGGLSNEIRHIRHGWAAWESGHFFLTLSEYDIKGLDRILIWAPGGPLVKQRARDSERRLADITETISEATQRALEAGIEVRQTNEPLLNCVIHDPEADNAWARVQLQLPKTDAVHWPGFRVYKAQEPEVFNNIVTAYDRLWKSSQPIYMDSSHAPSN